MDPVDLARRLVGIESVNPDLVPTGSGERAIADYCAAWLADAGFDVNLVATDPSRPSVIAVSRGSGGGRSLALSGHLDTVGGATFEGDPFLARVEGDRLIGRGAFDMKGGLAALLVAAASASRERRGDVVVALVADEEFGSRGTEEVLDRLADDRPDAAIICEPSNLELTVAHRGFAWFRIDVDGRAAHGSMPDQGVDAIAGAYRVMAALDELGQRLRGTTHPLLVPDTVRVATIAGGSDAATVAASCTLTVERRFLPGRSPEEVESELRAALESVDASVRVTRLVARAGFEAGEDSAIRAAVSRSLREVTGRAVERGEPFWTDAGLFAEAGIPTVLVGVDGDGAHADHEWASIASIRALADVLRRSVDEFCA